MTPEMAVGMDEVRDGTALTIDFGIGAASGIGDSMTTTISGEGEGSAAIATTGDTTTDGIAGTTTVDIAGTTTDDIAGTTMEDIADRALIWVTF
jgi:hypothetical protein